MEGIQNPSQVFQTTVLPTAFDSVDTQYDMNAKVIMKALSIPNAELAFVKFYQLVKFTDIFPDNQLYKNNLSQILKEIGEFFEKKYQEGMENIQNSFTKYNQITQKDVNIFYEAFKHARMLDIFVKKFSEIWTLDENDSWKTSKHYISNVQNLCSFSNFPQNTDICSKKWNQYMQAIGAIIEYLNDKKEQEIKELIEIVDGQFEKVDDLFKNKVEIFCKQSTIALIKEHILNPNTSQQIGQEIDINYIKKCISNFIDSINSALQIQAENKAFSDKLSEAKVYFLSQLCEIFNEFKYKELQQLIEGIEIMKKSQQEESKINKYQNSQIVVFTTSLLQKTSSFLDIHQEIYNSLSLQVNNDFLIDFKKIGGDLKSDMEQLYGKNEQKLNDLILNPNAVTSNIKNSFEQIITLRKIPYLKNKTNTSFNLIINKIKELFENQKSIIEKVIPELENLIKKRMDNIEFFTNVKQLKKALKRLIDLKEISDDFQQFYNEAAEQIKTNIDLLKQNIEEKIKSYDCSFGNIEKFQIINQMNQQLLKLKDLAELINYKDFNIEIKYLSQKHKNLLEIIEQYIKNREIKIKNISDDSRFIQSSDCNKIQQMYQYLEECSKNDFIQRTLELGKEVDQIFQDLKNFIDKNMKLMNQEISQFCFLIQRLSDMNSLNIPQYKQIVNDQGSFQIDEQQQVSIILDHMQDIVNKRVYLIRHILKTLEIIYQKKHFEQEDSGNLTEQLDLLKQCIDKILQKVNNKYLGEINLEINCAIIGKLILLDPIIYKEEFKIDKTYKDSFNSMKKAQSEQEIKANDALEGQDYELLRSIIDDLSQLQSNQEIIKQIRKLASKKVKELCDYIKSASLKIQDEEYDLKTDFDKIKKNIQEVLQIRKVLQQKNLIKEYGQILIVVTQFFNQFNECLEKSVKSLGTLVYDQYYKQKNYWDKACDIMIKNGNTNIYLKDIDKQEESEKHDALKKELVSIIKLHVQIQDNSQDPINLVEADYSQIDKLNIDSFEKLKSKQQIEKLQSIQHLTKEQKDRLDLSLDQIFKNINSVYQKQNDDLTTIIINSMKDEVEIRKDISKIEKSIQYIPKAKECDDYAKIVVNDLLMQIEKQKTKISQQMNNELKSCGENNFEQVLKIYERYPNGVNEEFLKSINEKSTKFIKDGINLIDTNLEDLLKNQVKLLQPILKINDLLMANNKIKQSDEIFNVYVELKDKINDRFNSLAKNIIESWKKDLNMKANQEMKNQVTSQEECQAKIKELKIFLLFRIENKQLFESLGFIVNFNQILSEILKTIKEAVEPLVQEFDQKVANEDNFIKIIELILFINFNKNLIQTYQKDDDFYKKIEEILKKPDVTLKLKESLQNIEIRKFIKSFYDLHIKMKVDNLQEYIENYFKNTEEDINIVLRYFKQLQNIQGIDEFIKNTCEKDVKQIRDNNMIKFLEKWLQLVLEVNQISKNLQDQKSFDKIQQKYNFILELSENVEKSKVNWEGTEQIKIVYNQILDTYNQIEDKLNELLKKQYTEWGKFKDLKDRQQEQIAHTSQIIVFVQNLKNIYRRKDLKKQECQKFIDTIIEEVGNINNENGKNAIVQLKQNLIKIEKIGYLILSTYPIFQGYQNEKINETFKKIVPKDIFDLTYGNITPRKDQKDSLVDCNIDKYFLEKKFNEFNKKYNEIIKENLDGQEEKELDKICYSLKKEIIDIEQKSIIGKTSQDGIIVILANIFSIWTLQNSGTFFKNKGNLDFEKGQNYLLKPHIGQVIALLRIFGLGYSKPNPGNKQNSYIRENQFKLFNRDTFFNNIISMKQGEGKTLVIAIASIIFALWGFEVNCCQQTEYLSHFNFKKYEKLFKFFEVEKQIQYATLQQICHNEIDRTYGSIELESAYLDHILQHGFFKKIGKKIGSIFGGGQTNARKTVLLFEEVSCLLDKNIFGQIYKPKLKIIGEWVDKLFEFIWKHRNEKIEIEKNGTLKAKDQQRFKDGISNFKDDFKDLYIQALIKILFDLDQLKQYDYKVQNSKVYFKQQGIWTSDENFEFGYLQIFAYYDYLDKNQFNINEIKGKTYLFFECGKFCYSQILKQFGLIVGASCTLENLNDHEKSFLKSEYDFHNFTQINPVFDQKKLDWKKNELRIQIFNDHEYFGQIKNQIVFAKDSTQTKQEQPVLVVFKNYKRLLQFYQKFQQHYKMQIIFQGQSIQEIDQNVKMAGQQGEITLITSKIIQGIDFQCSEFALQGFYIIQTFLSSEKSEYLSIRGRTARLGKNGSYIMILNKEELQEDFGYDENFKESNNQLANIHKYLKSLREISQNGKYQYVQKILEYNSQLHDKSMQTLQLLKFKLNPKEICYYLSTINESPNRNDKVYRTLILLEATETMKAYNIPALLKYHIPYIMDQLHSQRQRQFKHQFKVAIYRNYNCTEETIYQSMNQWNYKIEEIQKFLSNVENKSAHNDKYGELIVKDKAAIEIGAYFANEEIETLKKSNLSHCQISQIIIIGKSPYYTEQELTQIYDDQNQSKWLKNIKNKKDYLTYKYLKYQLIKIQKNTIPVTMISIQNPAIAENDAILTEHPLQKVFQCQDPNQELPKILYQLIDECLSGKLNERKKPIPKNNSQQDNGQNIGNSGSSSLDSQSNQNPQVNNQPKPAELPKENLKQGELIQVQQNQGDKEDEPKKQDENNKQEEGQKDGQENEKDKDKQNNKVDNVEEGKKDDQENDKDKDKQNNEADNQKDGKKEIQDNDPAKDKKNDGKNMQSAENNQNLEKNETNDNKQNQDQNQIDQFSRSQDNGSQ